MSRSQNPLFVWVKGPAEAEESRQTMPSQEPPRDVKGGNGAG